MDDKIEYPTDKIKYPFRVKENDFGNRSIYDANDNVVLTVWASMYWDCDAFIKPLCTVMNENHERLVRAANGECEAKL